MPLIETEENAMCDFEAARLVYLSLHVTDPGTTGDDECTSTDYARQPLVWAPAVAGSASAQQVSFSVDAGEFDFFGFYDSATDGNFLGGNALNQPQSPSVPSIIKVTPTLTVLVS
jgi:hypothetical protein